MMFRDIKGKDFPTVAYKGGWSLSWVPTPHELQYNAEKKPLFISRTTNRSIHLVSPSKSSPYAPVVQDPKIYIVIQVSIDLELWKWRWLK